MPDATLLDLGSLTGYALVRLNVLSTSIDITRIDARRVNHAIAVETARRGWPGEWWEDPSVLPRDLLDGARKP